MFVSPNFSYYSKPKGDLKKSCKRLRKGYLSHDFFIFRPEKPKKAFDEKFE